MTSAILSVSQLNRLVAGQFDAMPAVQVAGEISNFTCAASGHWYFTLKDDRASVRVVMFRGRASAVGFTPKAGDRVEIRARVTLYEPRGDYQLQAEGMRRAGLGDLYEAFLLLKGRLEAEGLLDAARKREMPVWPRAIGIVTSLQAAALQDVLTTLRRRVPHIPVYIYPAPVQGADAAARLVQALGQAQRHAEADVLLLVRGGGSIEDLWSFNDEGLARAIAACDIPVVSGVGHETDFTIADFVADLRAPTPTAAAELCCEPRQYWLDRVGSAAVRIAQAQRRQHERAAQRLDRAVSSLLSPAQQLALQRQRLLMACHRLQRAWRGGMSVWAGRLEAQRARFGALDPRLALQRGYAIVRDGEGHVLDRGAGLAAGGIVRIEFAADTAAISIAAVEHGTKS